MEAFSIRHDKALREKRIRVSMKERLRTRLWKTVQKFNEHQPDPYDDSGWEPDLVEQTEMKLKVLLGPPELKVKAESGEKTVDIHGYFTKGDPSCALEVIEQFFEALPVLSSRGRAAPSTSKRM
jgi:hypothetical protein